MKTLFFTSCLVLGFNMEVAAVGGDEKPPERIFEMMITRNDSNQMVKQQNFGAYDDEAEERVETESDEYEEDADYESDRSLAEEELGDGEKSLEDDYEFDSVQESRAATKKEEKKWWQFWK